MYKQILIVPLSFFLIGVMNAQEFSKTTYEVISEGQTLKFPFAGGMQAPQLSSADLNRDGMNDLYVFDRGGEVSIPFIYKGPAGQANYEIDWTVVDSFPRPPLWALLRDFNGDGVEDMFASTVELGIQGVDVYRGIDLGDRLGFERMTFDLGSFDVLYIEVGGNFTPMYAAWTDVPAIDDVDGDGDLDILSFEPGGAFLSYYKNLTLEQGLGLDTLVYDWNDVCWGKFRENDFNEEVFLSDDPDECANPVDAPIQSRHSGSTQATFDFDNDGDKDLYLGDLASSHITFLLNGGDNENAWITEQTLEFPTSTTSAEIEFFVTTSFVDINGDGFIDFTASNNSDNFSENVDVLWYYQNRGGDGDADFRFVTRNFLVGEMLDFGSSARPAIFDADGDGLRDIVIGTSGYYNGGMRDPRLILLRNIGTATEPSYEVADEDYLNFSAFGALSQFGFAPEAGDLDGDGDVDLIIGEFDGGLFFLENIALSGNAPVFDDPVYPYKEIFVGAASTPAIMDINGDGLNDMVVGERIGNNGTNGKCSNLNYYQNVGEAGNPDFISDVNTAPNNGCFGEVLFNGQIAIPEYSAPEFIRVDGEVLLVIGSESGKLYQYGNVIGNTSGSFDIIDDNLANLRDGFRVVPEIEDIDDDGLYEMILGNFRGGLTAYDTDIQKDVTSTDGLQGAGDEQNFVLSPNPASYIFTISGLSDERVEMWDISGRQIQLNRQGNVFNIQDLTPGPYIVRISGENWIQSLKLIVARS